RLDRRSRRVPGADALVAEVREVDEAVGTHDHLATEQGRDAGRGGRTTVARAASRPRANDGADDAVAGGRIEPAQRAEAAVVEEEAAVGQEGEALRPSDPCLADGTVLDAIPGDAGHDEV